MTTDDMELVRQYAAHQSESAFTALVSRHTNLVYSASLRLVRNPQLAEEVTQAVFIILARKAGSLDEKTILSGWLYRTACFVSGSALKQEYRRQRREQEAYMQSTLNEAETDAVWKQMSPLLEEAMLRLKQTDRDALVLRFFEGRSLSEVGAALGANEETAKKRVNRAVEKLQKFFLKRGVSSTTATLAGAISANSVHAAPVALVKTATAIAFAKGATASGSTLTLIQGALKLMAWTKAKTAIVSTVVVGMATFSAVQYQAQVKLREQNQTLQRQQSLLAGQIQQLQQERDDATNRVGSLLAENSQLKSNPNQTELLKLRGEVGTLRQQSALTKNMSPAEAMAQVMTNSSAVELARAQLLQTLKSRYTPLVQALNLSPETSDRLFNLITENELNKKMMYAQLVSGDLNVETALQDRDNAKIAMDSQIAALLGDSGYAQFDQFNHDSAAAGLVKGLNGELGDKALNDDQSNQLQTLFAAKPDINIDDMDLFRSTESLDALFQTLVDRGHHDLQAAASFLTPEQLAAASVIQSNYFGTLRKQLTLGQQSIGKFKKPNNP